MLSSDGRMIKCFSKNSILSFLGVILSNRTDFQLFMKREPLPLMKIVCIFGGLAMKKKLAVLAIALFLMSKLFAISVKNDFRNLGTAKELNGKTYVLLIFVSYPGTEWSTSSINEFVSRVYAATGWLTKVAAEHGKTAEFSIYTLGNTALGLPKISMAAPQYSTTIIDDAMAAAGYPPNYDFDRYVRENTDCTNSLVIVCSNESGRCFSIPHNKELSDWNKTYRGSDYKLEGLVAYISDMYSGEFIWPSTIAHEILHCFGAWDLYDVYGTNSYEKNTLLEQYFSNSIMRTINANINLLTVDDLTAYLVGLTTKREDWYEYFQAY